MYSVYENKIKNAVLSFLILVTNHLLIFLNTSKHFS